MSRKETSREYVMSSKRGGFARPGPPATGIRSTKDCSAQLGVAHASSGQQRSGL